MIARNPHGPRSPSARPTRGRQPMVWRLVLLGALTGSLSLGVVLSAIAAPAPHSGVRASALVTSTLWEPMEGTGGPWVP